MPLNTLFSVHTYIHTYIRPYILLTVRAIIASKYFYYDSFIRDVLWK